MNRSVPRTCSRSSPSALANGSQFSPLAPLNYVFRRLHPFLILLSAIAALGTGCTSSATQVIGESCPPPPRPVCAPGSFNEVRLDTLFHGPGTTQNHISVAAAPLSTNSPDFGVSFYRSGSTTLSLVTSSRTSATGDESSGRDGLWAYKVGTREPISIDGLDTIGSVGAACYCSSDSRLYFSAHAPNSDPDDYDLYSARVEYRSGALKLAEVTALTALNDSNRFDSQPAVDASGTSLVFATDRPGGTGGVDLWISHRSSASASWQTPHPLEPPVNTECDELSPSFGSDGRLYFASNGHATVGGYDLFSASYGAQKFDDVQNLGIPINTSYDELFPVKVNDSTFFWSSNRPGGPELRNIYTITRTGLGRIAVHAEVEHERPVVEHLDTLPKGPVDLYVDVTAGENGKPAVGAELFVRRDSVEIYRAKSPQSGKFKIKLKRDVYDVGAENSASFFDVRRLDLRKEPDSVAHLTLNLPDTLVLRINFPFDDYEHPYEFVVNDQGGAGTMRWSEALDLTARSTLRSIKSLKKLVVIGHTDSLGSDEYNQRLGEHRAEFIASELIKRGVPKKILSVSSRGRTEPVAMRPGETDEQFRLRSRRVEFVKVF
jgi:hypothetical protein